MHCKKYWSNFPILEENKVFQCQRSGEKANQPLLTIILWFFIWRNVGKEKAQFAGSWKELTYVS
jgi:hypothetical protein